MKIFLLAIVLIFTGCAQSQHDKYLAKKCENTLSFGGIISGKAEACYEMESAKLRCKEYGFNEGSSDFSKCLMAIDTERKIKKQISDEAERTRFLLQPK